MGWYTTLKPFSRKMGDATITHQRGDRLHLDYREESERLLRNNTITRGKVKVKPLTEAKAELDPMAHNKEIISDLAKEAGLTHDACNTLLKRHTQPDPKTGLAMPLDAAVLRVKDSLNLLDEQEQIELLASDLGVDDFDANEQVAEVVENHDCSITEAVETVKAGNGYALNDGARVLVGYKDDIRCGVIIKVCEGDEVRVKLDDDDAAYRRINRADIELDRSETKEEADGAV